MRAGGIVSSSAIIGFKNAISLKCHIDNIHQGENVNCELCEKMFASKGNLDSHKRRVHTNAKIKCNLCEKAFTGLRNLTHHKSAAHKSNGLCSIESAKAHLEDKELPFTFDSDNFLSIKKEIKEEIQDDPSFCKNIKTEDQTFEIEQLRQSCEVLKKELEQSLTEIKRL